MTEFQIHAQLTPAQGQISAPIILRSEPRLGLLALGECQRQGPDAEAAVHLVVNAVVNQLCESIDDIKRYRQRPGDRLRARLVGALEEALQRAHRELSLFSRRRGGGLEVGLELLLRLGAEVFVAHVGPGAIYMVRRDLLHRLVWGALPEHGESPTSSRDEEQAARPALLGGPDGVQVETLIFEIWPGDHIALITGGLAERLEDADVRTLLAVLEPEQAARGLLHMARERGAIGALGAYLARVPGDPEQVQDSVAGLLPVLGRMPLLGWCNREELLDVAAVARPKRLARGDTIFAEGDQGSELYLLVQGEVSVMRSGTSVARLGPGSTFGEMALLDQPVRSATVESLGDGELLVITREAFYSLLKANPNLAVKLLWNLLIAVSGNLRRTTAMMSELVSGIRVPRDPDQIPTLSPDEVPTRTMRKRR